ncbi:Alpha-tocopherol transfer protein-like protein, partial [Stegodyphus mimosarum]
MHHFCLFIATFLPKKLKQRVYIHGHDVKSLHRYIPSEVLPPELGGTAEPVNMHNYQSFILSQEAYIQKLNQYGFINNT